VYEEYQQQDFINNRPCFLGVKPPNLNMPKEEIIQTMISMVRTTYSFVVWRQCLIVALVTFLVLKYMLSLTATISESLMIIGFIFVSVFFSYSWLTTHFLQPNGKNIEKILRDLYSAYKNGSVSK
jgi:O-antigen/teichoic acid export membrane protein